MRVQAGPDAADVNHPFAALRNLRVKPIHANSEPTQSKAPVAWRVNEEGEILHGDLIVAKLIAGTSVSQPRVQALTDDSGKERTALQEHAQRAVRHHVETLLHALEATDDASNEARGIFYQLRTGLGTVTTSGVASLLEAANQHDRHQISQAGVITGRLSVYCRRLLKPAALRQRLALARAFFAADKLPEVRRLGDVSLPRPKRASRDEDTVAMCLGYIATSSLWVRCDVAERALAAGDALEGGDDSRELTSMLGCKRAVALRVMEELRQRSGLPRVQRVGVSRNASRNPEPVRHSSFRRQRDSKKVKHNPESTASSEK
jgi:hypothetical protein